MILNQQSNPNDIESTPPLITGVLLQGRHKNGTRNCDVLVLAFWGGEEAAAHLQRPGGLTWLKTALEGKALRAPRAPPKAPGTAAVGPPAVRHVPQGLSVSAGGGRPAGCPGVAGR